MAVKASGAYKNCKPCSGSSRHDRSRAYVDSDAGSVSERFYGSYRRPGSSNSTPRLWGKEMEVKLKALSSGSVTPSSVSGRTESVVFSEEDEPKEWVAQVEPGVLITFVPLPHSGNDLKRIRFSREIFDKWQAQRWWAENYDKVIELYNVQKFNLHAIQLPTPPRSEDENSKLESTKDSPVTPPLSKERPTEIGYSSSDSFNTTLCNLDNTMIHVVLIQHQNSPASVLQKLGHRLLILLRGQVLQERMTILESFQ
ncbi:hypothetical protein DH2020_013211 [Rehmannia glutinosa]|uniref:BRX domain-containing protein n=1 Tax=Rehmannia glutinosa TaxID=99300 RepID=A0ABR0X1L5_REHGL